MSISTVSAIAEEDCPIEAWTADPRPELFPYAHVVASLRAQGKHFIPADLIAKLSAARARIGPASAESEGGRALKRFLNVVLDKADGAYDYITYIAVDVLDVPAAPSMRYSREQGQQACDLWVVSLIADALCFEHEVLKRRRTYLPLMPPSDALVEKRCQLGLKAVRPALRRLGLPDYDAELPIGAQVEGLVAGICARPGALPQDRLERSMLPVYLVHDEHLFIRVLQSFEVTFFWISFHLKAAYDAFENDPPGVVTHLEAATEKLVEASRLFLFLATMRADSFRDFRKYTEGASAIQSRSYKEIESLCRRPDSERLDSIAYHSVPEVLVRVLSGRGSLDDALLKAALTRVHAPAALESIEAAMGAFSSALQTWKRAHYGIAVKMLGEAPGTGYTEGTPYLRSVIDIPVFKFQSERMADVAAE